MLSVLTCFFFALIASTASINFNFTTLTPDNSHDIIFSGDAAYTSDDGIQVTYKNINRTWERLAGRVTYFRPLHLWDKNSTYLASFSTSFTFVIKSYMENLGVYGDGLTFFIAQNNSVINAGGSMGLPFNYQNNTSLHPFVAVEFDTYGTDDWDPNEFGNHVGININSLTSVVYRNWSVFNVIKEVESRALISYNSDSKNLAVSFTNFENNSLLWETGLNYTIDLRHTLPEWVIFGFSASTGDGYEKNNLRSWVFNSSEFEGEENNRLPPTEDITQSSSVPPANNTDPSSSVSLASTKNVGKVGLIAGTLVLVFHYMAVL